MTSVYDESQPMIVKIKNACSTPVQSGFACDWIERPSLLLPRTCRKTAMFCLQAQVRRRVQGTAEVDDLLLHLGLTWSGACLWYQLSPKSQTDCPCEESGLATTSMPALLAQASTNTNLKASLWYDSAAVMTGRALFRAPLPFIPQNTEGERKTAGSL